MYNYFTNVSNNVILHQLMNTTTRVFLYLLTYQHIIEYKFKIIVQ